MPSPEGGAPSPVTLGVPTAANATVLHGLVDDVLRSGCYSNSGPLAAELEHELSSHLGVEHAVLVSSGTMALTLALLDLDLQPGAEVVTSPLTFVATASAIAGLGLRVRFADVDPLTGNLDVQQVERSLTARTGAIMPVHLFGQPCAVTSFQRLSRDTGIPVIHDAAHAFGALAFGRPIGSWGEMSAFSLHATKLMHTGEGGVITTSDGDRADRLRERRTFGLREAAPQRSGTNAKLPELSAALGLSVLPELALESQARMRLATQYDSLFAGAGIPTLHGVDEGSLIFYAITPPAASRPALLAALRRAGLVGRTFPALNESAAFGGAAPADSLRGQRHLTETPVAAALSRSMIALPFHSRVRPGHLEALATLLR